MLWYHEEVARLRRMVGSLLGYVIPTSAVFVIPVTEEVLTEYWVEWFLDAAVLLLAYWTRNEM